MAKKIFLFFLRILAGPGFSNEQFNGRVLLKHAIRQKLCRINAHVPWPVHPSTQVKGVEHIQKGTRNPGMSIGCILDGRNGIHFGKNVWVGPYVSIISQNHDSTLYTSYIEEGPITIGDNSWIGAHAIILPGVTLGAHTIVGAGAVVTKSFTEGNQLIAGNPARKIKDLPLYQST